MVKRGRLAWGMEQDQPSGGFLEGLPNRLVVHRVTDDTNLKSYVPAVEAWLLWCQNRGLKLEEYREMDCAAADFLKEQCYQGGRGPQIGSNLMAGIKHVFPELADRPWARASRAQEGYKSLVRGKEGFGNPWEAVISIMEFLAVKGYPSHAICIGLQADGIMREQDWEGLLRKDIYDDGKYTILEFGLLERGEKTKTGAHQGVRVERDWVRDLLKAQLVGLEQDDFVFDFTQIDLRLKWAWAKRALGLTFLGPLHSLRHTEPAAAVEQGTKTFEEIRRRGRWASLKSVQRYSKDFQLVKLRSKMPEDIIARGEELLDDPYILVEVILDELNTVRCGPGCCRRRRRQAKQQNGGAGQIPPRVSGRDRLGVSADASKAGHNGLSTCSGFPAGVDNVCPDAQLEEETSLHLDALQPFPSEKGWSRKKEE